MDTNHNKKAAALAGYWADTIDEECLDCTFLTDHHQYKKCALLRRIYANDKYDKCNLRFTRKHDIGPQEKLECLVANLRVLYPDSILIDRLIKGVE